MNVKHVLASLLLLTVVCFSCKKNKSTVVPTTTVANIDSITGHYYGTTSGDSIYSYTGTGGVQEQVVKSFSWTDTLNVTSSDTAHITVSSNYYNVTFTYGDSLTIYPFTFLQNDVAGQNGYISFNSTLSDTTGGVNHLIINVWYSYNKHYTSDVLLYKR